MSITATGTVIGTTYSGIDAFSNGTDMTIAAVAVSGAYYGINAKNNGSGTLSITVTGAVTGGSGYGIKTKGATTVITLNSGAAVSSTSGKGIYNNLGDTTITVNTGASVSGSIVLSNGSDNLTFAGGDFSGVTLFDGGDDSDVSDGFIDTLTFAGSNGTLDGAIVTNWEAVVIGSGSTINFSNSALSVGGLSILSGGTLNASGNMLALTGALANTGGTLSMQGGATGDAVTVSGDYTGGGTLQLDVDTGADTADRLVVTGNVTGGVTQIELVNVASVAPTGNDITLVQVTGTSSESDFTLTGGSLTAGAFVYTLSQSGNDFVLGVNASSASGNYETALGGLAGFTDMGSLKGRIDQRVQGAGGAVARRSTFGGGVQKITQNRQVAGQALWLRISGSNLNTAPASSTSGVTGATRRIRGFQAGFDIPIDAGSWVLGVNAQYGLVNASVTSGTGTGTMSATGTGIGATATWLGMDGTYVDTQAQFTWINSDFASSGSGPLATGVRSTAYALSTELGRAFVLKGGPTLTPQAQLSYGMVKGASFTDLSSNIIDLGSNGRLQGRLGLGYTLNKASGWNINLTGNLLHDFSGTATVVVGGTTLRSVAQKTWGEVELGANYDMGGNTYFDVQASYRTSLSGNSSGNNGIGAALSIQKKW